MSQYIKTKKGIPQLRVFAAQTGTPILVNTY
jgi:hypothetical protein